MSTPAAWPALTSPSEGERRQLTVMFCDLVGSTSLASQVDPEDFRDLLQAYHDACADVISRFDGYIAQYLRDGLLIYFGYPQAHEDEAWRAVRAGLGIVEAIAALNAQRFQTQGVRLAVRLGIHTGLVVVGQIGRGDRQGPFAVGEAPNVAARLQECASPDTVVISAATYRLVQGFFVCEALGARQLKGVSDPSEVYRVLQASGVDNRFDRSAATGLTPLVGRTAEVALLLERWADVVGGLGQVVLLSGEAGIGKSRLVQVLKTHVAQQAHTLLECRCSPYHQHSAFYPVIEPLQRLLQWQQDDAPAENLTRLEQRLAQWGLPVQEMVSLLAPLLALPTPAACYPPASLSPGQQRRKTLEALLALFLAVTTPQPLLLVVEDIHWVDPSTRELLDVIIAHGPTVAMLTVLTYRPEMQPPGMLQSMPAHLTHLTLTRLSCPHVENMVTQLTHGHTLPPAMLQCLVRRSDGVPLFIEEMTKTCLESGMLSAVEVSEACTTAIPATLQDALMARLDRLGSAKGIAQLGAVVGRQFSYGLLQAVAQRHEDVLQQELQRLVKAEILYQRGVALQATYIFKHALIQDVAYQSLLKRLRQQYHQRVAQTLVAHCADTAALQPELVAHHYTEAGDAAPAVDYWQRAGQRAVQHFAYAEAMAHLSRGLEVLQALPATAARDQQEFALQITLGSAVVAAKGYAHAHVERVYSRARVLCQQTGTPAQLFVVLQGLFLFHNTHAEFQTAYELAEQLLHLARSLDEAAYLMEAHRSMGGALFFRSELGPALAHLEQSLALAALQPPQAHNVLHGQDPVVICHCYAAFTLWLLGYADQALQHTQAAIQRAQALSHPHSVGFAMVYAGLIHQSRREARATQECSEATLALATAHGFPFLLALAAIPHGWALAAQGRHDEGIAEMRQGLQAWRAGGAALGQTMFLAGLAEVYGQAGQPGAGLPLLAEALAMVKSTGERHYEAELWRLQGELLLLPGETMPRNPRLMEAEAEECFIQALAVARSQQAKSLELRAAMSLVRLWRQQGKHAEAHALLAPLYSWFSEGFDTADLQEARALMTYRPRALKSGERTE